MELLRVGNERTSSHRTRVKENQDCSLSGDTGGCMTVTQLPPTAGNPANHLPSPGECRYCSTTVPGYWWGGTVYPLGSWESSGWEYPWALLRTLGHQTADWMSWELTSLTSDTAKPYAKPQRQLMLASTVLLRISRGIQKCTSPSYRHQTLSF